LIDTGQHELEKYRGYAGALPSAFGLRFEEIAGATTLVEKMLNGPWLPEEFVVAQPGQTIRLDHFLRWS